MKLSVSLAADDVALIDEIARRDGLPSRSAVVQRALRQLRIVALEDDYAQAWQEWEESGDAADWDALAGDGLDGTAPRAAG
ncbi:ribbon-helix-helix domain-containing protein [Nocardioides humi]|uniref:Type II toxin-antitoxin system antitoxin MazE9 n=1 Tax=Nocardioides humi TaxID=449461 RepID=A0ABN2BIE6_9ACTN|nr:ribbon-helix-helix domain-containing protein [Nocardioides humi]